MTAPSLRLRPPLRPLRYRPAARRVCGTFSARARPRGSPRLDEPRTANGLWQRWLRLRERGPARPPTAGLHAVSVRRASSASTPAADLVKGAASASVGPKDCWFVEAAASTSSCSSSWARARYTINTQTRGAVRQRTREQDASAEASANVSTSPGLTSCQLRGGRRGLSAHSTLRQGVTMSFARTAGSPRAASLIKAEARWR
jgi:hypothetical protein